MKDPSSTISSAIEGLIAACIRCSTNLRHACIQHFNTPALILALANEATDCGVVLARLHRTVPSLRVPRTDGMEMFRVLDGPIQHLNGMLGELEALVRALNSGSSKSSVCDTTWHMKRIRADELRFRLREARTRTNELLTSYTGSTTGRIRLQLQGVQLVTKHAQDRSRSCRHNSTEFKIIRKQGVMYGEETRMVFKPDGHSQWTPGGLIPFDSLIRTVLEDWIRNPRTQKSHLGQGQITSDTTIAKHLENTIVVSVMQLRTRCINSDCGCACHTRSASLPGPVGANSHLSKSLRYLLRALFSGYTVCPSFSNRAAYTYTNQCSKSSCISVTSPTKPDILTYAFPIWFLASTAINLHLEATASLALRPPLRAHRRIRLDPGTLLYSVYQGDLTSLRHALISGDRTQLQDVTEHGGYPILTLALKSQRPSVEMLRLLLRAGADPDHRDDTGTSPRTLAAIAVLAPWLSKYPPKFLSKLPTLFSLSWQDCIEDGLELTYLHKVSLNLHPFGLSHALRQRPLPEHLRYQLNAFDACSLTPLILAASQQDVAGVRVLLAAGADPNIRSSSGTTALFYAVGNVRGCTESPTDTLAALVAAGADVNAQDGDGYTPLRQAALGGNVAAMKVLLDGGARPTLSQEVMMTATGPKAAPAPILYAIHGESVEATKLLLERGENLLFRDYPGERTLVYFSVQVNSHACLEFLLGKLLDDQVEAVVGAIATGHPLWPTLLHVAAGVGDVKTLEILARWTAGWRLVTIPPEVLLGLENCQGQTPLKVFEVQRDLTEELVVAFRNLMLVICHCGGGGIDGGEGRERGRRCSGKRKYREEEGEERLWESN
ncbi:hypothetical protein QBC35DRAFT_210328 [Podospora australis]|uniref:Ankyrin n=1 Tax=Podospora australis TaxID=1536484 RepID=A0AAN6WTR7_9PEZI|nr:hypothetical protein QBC35DRAFT_210328 [Podospora australis]